MKTHLSLLLAAFAAFLSTTQAADTPSAIATDYRAKAAMALTKVNDTLEKATVPIIAALVTAGDTTAADEVKKQLKAKQDGEPVLKSHPKVSNLWTLYDAARLRAIDPAQKSAIARIESLLKSSDGKKLGVVEDLTNVRKEVEAGKIIPELPFPSTWTYHRSPDSKPMANMIFDKDGTWKLTDLTTPTVESGTWTLGDKNTLSLDFKGTPWKVLVTGKTAVVERPDYGKRYLLAVKP